MYVGIICEKFNSEGKYLGIDQFERKLTLLSGTDFADFQIISKENKIEFIYNANSEFLKGFKKGKSVKSKLPGNNNRIIRTNFNLADLKFNHEEISTLGTIFVSHNSFSIIDGKTYVFGYNKDQSKIRLGVMD